MSKWHLATLALVLALVLVLPQAGTYYIRVFEPSAQTLSTWEPTRWCKINAITNSTECESPLASSDCQPAYCILHLSYIPYNIPQTTNSIVSVPQAACLFYNASDVPDCLTDARNTAVQLAAPIQCAFDTGAFMTAFSFLILGPLAFGSLVGAAVLGRAIYRRLARRYRGRVFLLSPENSKNTTRKSRVAIQVAQGGSLIGGQALRHGLVDYLTRSGWEAPSATVHAVCEWNHVGWTSVSSLALLLLALGMWVGWLCLDISGFYYLTHSLTCLGDEWNTRYIPVMVELAVAGAAWLLFLLGGLALCVTWAWVMRHRRYLVLVNDELIYFQMSWLYGDVAQVQALRASAVTSEVCFRSTWKILCCCQWHPTLLISGPRKEDDLVHDLQIVAYHGDAVALQGWLNQHVQGVNVDPGN